MMETQSCIYLGIKVKPGPIERFKIENFTLENTVDCLKTEAEKKTSIPSASLELIHHGKILKGDTTLQDSGIKNGEMVHVVKKKTETPPQLPQSFTDAELQQIVTAVRNFGCTPNAAGWTRLMQLLNDDTVLGELIEAVPSLGEDCVTLSILNEVELLAALGLNVNMLRTGATARPELPTALRILIRLVRSRSNANTANSDAAPTSGFAYSLEALSDDEDAEDEESEDGGGNITREQLAAALQAANETMGGINVRTTQESMLRFLQAASEGSSSTPPSTGTGTSRSLITPEMFSQAITDAMNRANSSNPAGTPMEQSTAASSSQSPEGNEDFRTQLQHMNEMGLLDDALNLRALLICAGDVNAAINLVFNGAISDE